MKGKALYEIETETVNSGQGKNTKDLAKEILDKHSIKAGELQLRRLSMWIAAHNYGSRDYHGNVNIPAGREIKIPATKNNVLFVISDGQIMNKDLLHTVDIKIKKYKEQQSASCFNFANGGVRYEFEIQESKNWPTPRVMFCKDGGNWQHFSQGKFVHLNGKWGEKNYEKEVKIVTNKKGEKVEEIISATITERESSFEDEGIIITKIAARNSRAICYGKEKGEDGKHRFFWAQLADSFPQEPAGVKLPGVYVASGAGRDDKEIRDRYEYVMHRYDTDMKKHPAWAMQVLGGKVEHLMQDIEQGNEDREKARQREGIKEQIKTFLDKQAEITKELWERLKEEMPDEVKRGSQSFLKKLEERFLDDDRIIKVQKDIEKLQDALAGLSNSSVMPIVVDNERWYEISLPLSEDKEIDRVLDIGISDIERYEHYKTEHGGEVQCWLYDQKLEEYKPKMSVLDLASLFSFSLLGMLKSKARKDFINAVINHLAPNLKVHDGMGFNDGTCNFFFLAKMKKNPQYPTYSVFWCDEQEGFSEQWRNLHPKDRKYRSPIGALSIFPAIDWYYNKFCEGFYLENMFSKDAKIENFDNNFISALPYEEIDDDSRMTVGKNPIIFSSKEWIYSISYMWGVTDFQWNKRSYPENGMAFNSTLGIRDDNTVYIMGFYHDADCDEYISGYFFQKYIPQSLYKKNLSQENYSTTPFEHKWYFLSEQAFNAVDRYYNFLIYDAYDEERGSTDGYRPIRRESNPAYRFRGVEDRAQYYVVDVDWGESKDDFVRVVKAVETSWFSKENPAPVNPFYATIDPNQDDGKGNKIELNHSIKLTLRWDNVREQVVALFTNPCDDDIPFHLDRDGTLSEMLHPTLGKYLDDTVQDLKQNNMMANALLGLTSGAGIQYFNFINYDLKGEWSSGSVSFKLKFKERVRCYSSPSIKRVELEFKRGYRTGSVSVTITTEDDSIRYVTIGAIVNGRARRISQRYELSAEELYTGGFYGIGQRLKPKIELEIPLLRHETLGIDEQTLEELFYRDGQITHGTSIWFEDILGHKGIAEEFEIKGAYWKTLGKVYFEPDQKEYREEDRAAQESKLDEIVETISAEYGNKPVKIIGHCASINRPKNEMALSIERAKKVYNKITGKVSSIQRDSFRYNLYSYEGKGATDPASSNSTAEGMKNNRRVVVKVLVKD